MLSQGIRPTIPKDAHPRFVELLERCWQRDPSLRPDFAEIIQILQQIAKEVSLTMFNIFIQHRNTLHPFKGSQFPYTIDAYNIEMGYEWFSSPYLYRTLFFPSRDRITLRSNGYDNSCFWITLESISVISSFYPLGLLHMFMKKAFMGMEQVGDDGEDRRKEKSGGFLSVLGRGR